MISTAQNTISRVEYLMRNGFHVPTFLAKRIGGLIDPDPEKGLSIVIDSYHDELDYMDRLLNSE
jgi:hypothetical protein